MTVEVFRPMDASQLLAQIGRWNLAAISGGRVVHRETGVTLPVGRGYSVTIDLDVMDTYVVRRVYKRGAKVWIKKEWADVYADQIGEIAYQASCYHND